MKHYMRHWKSVFITSMLLSLFFSCRKSDHALQNLPNTLNDYTLLKQQFFNASTADPEVQKVAADIRKQDSILKFLPAFVKKNGIPKWDKVFYKTQSGQTVVASSNGRGINSSRTNNTNDENSQGIFLIPLQSTTSSDIQSYITAYKHSDSLYTYRLYNKDSLSAKHPDSIQEKKNLLNTEAVFGYFEKSINAKDSISVTTPNNGNLKNVQLNFVSTDSIGRYSGHARVSELICEVSMYINITYEWHDFTYTYNGEEGVWVPVSTILEITISCTGTGGGENIPPGGGGPNNYWFSFGTGYPWYNTGIGGSYYFNPNDPWYPWWIGNFEESAPAASIVNYLSSTLNLDLTQSFWLNQNPYRAYDIYDYITTTLESQSDANRISLDHINQMMTDPEYLNFVEDYAASQNQLWTPQMWWENNTWLSDPNNFNLDIDHLEEDDPLDKLTEAEKYLTSLYPIQAIKIGRNAGVAVIEAKNRFPGTILINDKGDAFRHAYWMALNEKDITNPGIPYLFGVAHESEDPQVLHLATEMDLFNNDIGLQVGNSVSYFASNTSVSNAVMARLLNGDLHYLFPLDFEISNEYDNDRDGIQDCSTCLDGILSYALNGVETIIIPTDQ